MALKKITKRKIKVGSREYDCHLWQGGGGWHYEVYGPVATISGWVNADLEDTLKEAQEHAAEKLPSE